MALSRLIKILSDPDAKSKNRISKAVHSADAFHKILAREKSRADRSRQQFSLIMLDMSSTEGGNDSASHILDKIRKRLRGIDEIGWYDKRRIAIILPYTSTDGARHLSNSICGLCNPPSPGHLFTFYTYPSNRDFQKNDVINIEGDSNVSRSIGNPKRRT